LHEASIRLLIEVKSGLVDRSITRRVKRA
jgi:hypothetical protein